MPEDIHLPLKGGPVDDAVEVARCEPDFNDLVWHTFQLLFGSYELDNPGTDEDIAWLFCVLLKKSSPVDLGTLYANPCGVVRSSGPSSRFLRIAREMQREWFSRFNKTMHKSRSVKAAMKDHGVIRQLALTGVLFIDGRHVFPHQWPDRALTAKANSRPRKRRHAVARRELQTQTD